MWRATGMIASANAAALGLQFLTTILVAREFGASAQMDAYTLAISIPEALQYLLMLASLSLIFTPLFIDARARHGEREAWSMALSLLALVVLFVLLLIPLLIVLMPWLMYLLAPGFAPETRALAIELSDLILPGLFYYATAGLLLGICYAYLDFTTPALNTLLLAALNLAAFLLLVQLLHWGVYGMIVGRLGALAAMEVFLVWRVWQHKHTLVAQLQLRNPRVWHLLTYLPPYMFGALSGQLELIITRSLISTLGAGSVAAWGYGQRLADIPIAVLGASVSATYLPDFATSVAQKNLTSAGAQWNRAAERVSFVLMPVAALLVALGAPLIALLFQRGAFDAAATQNSALVLAGLALVLPLRGVGGLIVRGMPAFKTRWLPLVLSAVSVGGTLVFAFALIGVWGIFGVAFAASIGDALFVIIGVMVFWRWLQFRTWQDEVVQFAKLTGAGIVSGIVAYGIAGLAWSTWFGSELVANLFQVGVAAFLGLLVFVAVCLLLRVSPSRALLTCVAERAHKPRAPHIES
jgi:putative peptidoglycan lipid II flippase